MSLEKCDGLVLRVTDFSETSRIVAIFSRQFGRFSALAKGGRRLKGPFESALDLLSECQLGFIRKSSSTLDLLTDARLVNRFRPPERDLACLYAGYYVAELLLGLTEDYDPFPVLYDEASATLRRLADSAQLRLNVLRFELVILREIGQLPDFGHCAACGAELGEGRTFGFWVQQGGLICPDCQEEEYSPVLIQAGTAAALRMLASDQETWQRLQPNPRQLKELRHVATLTICHTLGHRPKMLNYLQ